MPPRGHASSCLACQQESQQGDAVGHDACQTFLIKQDLRSLESLDQPVAPRLLLVWLSSTSIWLGSRVLEENGRFLIGQGLTRRRAAALCASPPASSARYDVGKPLGYDE
jgi:hypothetical protein